MQFTSKTIKFYTRAIC